MLKLELLKVEELKVLILVRLLSILLVIHILILKEKIYNMNWKRQKKFYLKINHLDQHLDIKNYLVDLGLI